MMIVKEMTDPDVSVELDLVRLGREVKVSARTRSGRRDLSPRFCRELGAALMAMARQAEDELDRGVPR